MRKLIAEIKRFVRRAVVTVLTVAFLVVATFGALTIWFDDPEAHMEPAGERPYFTGPPEQVAADIRAFEELGVRHLRRPTQRYR